MEKENLRENIKFKISDTGDIEFDGNCNHDMLLELLNQAAYIKSKSEKVQVKKIEIVSGGNLDSAVIVFCALSLFLIMTITQSIVSAIAGNFIHNNSAVKLENMQSK